MQGYISLVLLLLLHLLSVCFKRRKVHYVKLISYLGTFYINGLGTLTSGSSSLVTFSVAYPPPSDVTLTLVSPCLTLANSSFTFTPSRAHFQASLFPTRFCAGDVQLLYSVTGTDAAWYAYPSSIALTVLLRNLQFTGNFQAVVGIPSAPVIVSPSAPSLFTVALSAPGLILSFFVLFLITYSRLYVCARCSAIY